DAIGMQGHTFSTRKYGDGPYTDATANLENNLTTLANLGLPIIITELDVEGGNSFDENGQPVEGGTQEEKDAFQLAEYQRVFDLYWNHPSVIGITLWGWREGMFQTGTEAFLFDPCTGLPRPALSEYLNETIRASEPPLTDFPMTNSFIYEATLENNDCACNNPENITEDNVVTLFQDALVITGAAPSSLVEITNSAGVLDQDGNLIEGIIGMTDEAGSFKLVFYSEVGVDVTADVRIGGIITNFSKEACNSCVIDVNSITLDICDKPAVIDFVPIEGAFSYQLEITIPSLNNTTITPRTKTPPFLTFRSIPRAALGTAISIRVAPVFVNPVTGRKYMGVFSPSKEFVLTCEENIQTNDVESRNRISTNVELSPNPASTALTVSLHKYSQDEGNVLISIFDLAGKLIRVYNMNIAEDGNTYRIDINDLSTGLYQLRIQTATDIQTLSFVKE
ncbi:MAG: endo-1,4-beta-xylanase, partial [Bacteroidota bacterium]